MEYIIHLTILILIYSILAQSLNLTIGLGRLFNFAHAAAYALGAYAAALGSTQFGLGPAACIVGSAAVSGGFALLLGGIALRLAGDYFAIGTLAFSAIVSALLVNWRSVTNGVLGITSIPRPEFFGAVLSDNADFLIFAALLSSAALSALYLLFRSPFARVLRAHAEDPLAAMALGRNVQGAAACAFVISSLFAGAAGALFAYYFNYIDPSSFSLAETIFLLSIVVVGSPGSFWGCLAATAFLVLLPESLRFIDLPSAVLGPLRQLIQSVVLLLVIWHNRARLFPTRREV